MARDVHLCKSWLSMQQAPAPCGIGMAWIGRSTGLLCRHASNTLQVCLQLLLHQHQHVSTPHRQS
jgi:hypothetical protein